ncbi:hypothetical protein ACFWP2_20585 [Kitasatospora sp. NPDC058444]|uniref:hypothetical protein n=1 Tax=Kitasatospora sp. NPDC058444 TaxID=3346504 RepID=UPI00364E8A76
MSPLTTDTEWTIGAVHTAQLHGLAGAWVLTGTATVWGVETTPDGATILTVQLADQPSYRRVPTHTAYARGEVSTLTNGRRQMVSPLTPQPGPTLVTIGWSALDRRAADDAPFHLEQADKALSDWIPVPDDGSALGVSALTQLRRAAAAANTRDDLIRRLRAGGVPRQLVADAAGVDPTRVTQLCRAIEPTENAERAKVTA